MSLLWLLELKAVGDETEASFAPADGVTAPGPWGTVPWPNAAELSRAAAPGEPDRTTPHLHAGRSYQALLQRRKWGQQGYSAGWGASVTRKSELPGDTHRALVPRARALMGPKGVVTTPTSEGWSPH